MSIGNSTYNRIGILSGSTMKIFACIFMAFDHVGLIFFPGVAIFRILGRLAFPLFAYFIAEGCKYSKNKLRRILTVSGIGILYVLFYLIYEKEWYCNIFITFSISISLIYLLKWFKKLVMERGKPILIALSALAFISVAVGSFILSQHVYVEYGFKGVMLPVIISLFDFKDIDAPQWLKRMDNHYTGLACMTLGLIPLCIKANLGYIQLFSFLSVLLLVFYNGKVGNKRMKYVFYIFYPAHLVLIEGIAMLLEMLK